MNSALNSTSDTLTSLACKIDWRCLVRMVDYRDSTDIIYLLYMAYKTYLIVNLSSKEIIMDMILVKMSILK